MNVLILRGDARELPLPDNSCDLVVTSPPFYGLRDYRDGGESLAGQIGTERTPQEYVAALLDCTREWMRVLKPDGSIFVELGDSYTAKSLNMAPHRYAIGCVDKLGLIKRAEIPWHHVNGLPESVTDRVRRSHSMIFHLTKLPRYYSAVDEIREPHAPASMARYRNGFGQTTYSAETGKSYRAEDVAPNPLGKMPGSVWNIPSQPLTVPPGLGIDHFAAFPMELPRRIIAGWSPPGVCTACGEGRRPVTDGERINGKHGPVSGAAWQSASKSETATGRRNNFQTIRTLLGYACACSEPDAPTRPAVVLDPFAGTGTTMLVASALGRIGVGIDRSADYCRLARWRTTDPAERAKAMQVPKPPPVPDGQSSLFDLAGEAS